MEHDVIFAYKREIFTELELARREQVVFRIAERFEAIPDSCMIVLPLNYQIEDISELAGSISHEYLHLILSELENDRTSFLFDNLGYNIKTGYNNLEE